MDYKTPIKIDQNTCSLLEALLDMIQCGLVGPADLVMLLSKRVLRIQRPGHQVLLCSHSLHLASAAPGTCASTLCSSDIH